MASVTDPAVVSGAFALDGIKLIVRLEANIEILAKVVSRLHIGIRLIGHIETVSNPH
jgi:hypothetical protein